MSNASSTSPSIPNTRDHNAGVVTASLLTVIIVATLVGGITGMALHGGFAPAAVAILAGLAGTITAGIVRNTFLIRIWQAAGVEDVGTPVSVIVSASIASLAGSLAAHEMVSSVGPLWSGVTGMLAGLISAGLMSILMLVHSLEPRSEAHAA